MWQKVLDLAKQLKKNMDEYEKHQADLEEVIWIFLKFWSQKSFQLYREYRKATEANAKKLEELKWCLDKLEDLNKYWKIFILFCWMFFILVKESPDRWMLKFVLCLFLAVLLYMCFTFFFWQLRKSWVHK